MTFQFPLCPLPPLSRVWVYLRDSGGETQDLASQRSYVLAYCEHYQLRLERVFEDGAISGGSTIGRDEFGLMIDLARQNSKPMVDGILYWDTKRFARNQLDSQFYKGDLRRRGYRLISLSDDIPDNEFSVVIEAFLEWKAQKDREDISKDTKRGLAYIVSMKDENGNYIGLMPGRPPTFFKGESYDTGLKRNNGQPRIVQRWVPDPETWERGKIAWEMRAERASYMEIEQELKLFPNTANPGSTYYAIFKNEIYIGRLHYGGRIYEKFVPQLATMEQWEKVQELSYERPAKRQSWPQGKLHPKEGRGDFLLSGLCRCMYCQANVHASMNRREGRTKFWTYYVCARKKARPTDCVSKQMSARKVETAIVDVVCGKVLTSDFVTDLVERVNVFLSDNERYEREIATNQKQLRRLEKAIANLLDMAELHPSADVIARLNQREQERDTLKRDQERLYRQIEQRSVRVDQKLVVNVLTDMKRKLREGELKVRKQVLRQVVEQIELGRDVARLHYRFPLTHLYFMPPTGFEPVSQP